MIPGTAPTLVGPGEGHDRRVVAVGPVMAVDEERAVSGDVGGESSAAATLATGSQRAESREDVAWPDVGGEQVLGIQRARFPAPESDHHSELVAMRAPEE